MLNKSENTARKTLLAHPFQIGAEIKPAED